MKRLISTIFLGIIIVSVAFNSQATNEKADISNNEMIEKTIDILPDGTRLETRLSDIEKYFYDDRYRYYSSLRDGCSLYRSDKDGKHKTRLIDAACQVIGVKNGTVFYLNATDGFRLYRVKGDGSGNKKLFDYSIERAEINGTRLSFISISNGPESFSSNTDGSGLKAEKLDVDKMNGDWNITDSQEIENKVIYIDGSLTVMQGASLTLENSLLVFNTGRPGGAIVPKDFKVGSNANIKIIDCSIISSNPLGGIQCRFEGSGVEVDGSRLGGISTGISMYACNNAKISNNVFYDRTHFNAVSIDNANGSQFIDNIVIKEERETYSPNICVQVGKSEDTLVKGNVLVRQEEVIFLSNGANHSQVIDNLILGDTFFAALSVRHDAGNNILEKNFIQGDYNGGYRQLSGDRWSTGIYIDSCQSTNIFRYNVINDCWLGIEASFMSNSIFDSNKIHCLMKNEVRQAIEPLCGICANHSVNNYFINNTVEGVDGYGAMLLLSKGNNICGNVFSGFKYGAGLWYGSDNNKLNGNDFLNDSANAVIEKSDNNTVSGNAFEKGSKNLNLAYNNGKNSWSSNYYEDKNSNTKSVKTYHISPNGIDGTPLGKKPPAVNYKEPEVLKIYGGYVDNSHPYTHISKYTLWKDTDVEYNFYNLIIDNGGTLELNNATLNAPKYGTDEPEMLVRSGGTLIIDNSKILSGDNEMYLSITAEEGSKVIVRKSYIKNLYNFDTNCNGGIFENSVFEGCFRSLLLLGSNNKVTNCKFSRCFIGISGSPSNKNIINNDTTFDSISDFKIK